MTQLELARAGKVSAQMRLIGRNELTNPDVIRKGIASGKIVIPKNKLHRISNPCGIGEGLRTKINTNIGTSTDSSNIKFELKKMEDAISLGSDAIMDLSTGPNIGQTRRAILSKSTVPVGTVPIYEIVISGISRHGSLKEITVDEMFDCLEEQALDGVDFFTIHAGVTRKVLHTLRRSKRILDMVSRGGAMIAQWMLARDRENPFYEHFDRVLDLARQYDITLSLGDGLRPGSIADATDAPQIAELMTLGTLRDRAVKAGVQVIIEGPGHVPIDQIETNVMLEKFLCAEAPFYVLGPIVTDVAPGYDHITAAIGGAIAGSAGADFLCYVTPSEHLRLPSLEDVKEGVIAARIAAHAADIAKGVKGAMDWDRAISAARSSRDWTRQFKLALEKSKPKKYREMSKPASNDVCTMCGEYCSIKVAEKSLKKMKAPR